MAEAAHFECAALRMLNLRSRLFARRKWGSSFSIGQGAPCSGNLNLRGSRYYFPVIDLHPATAIIAPPRGLFKNMNIRYASVMKWTVITLSVVLPLWLIACAGIYHVMRKPPEQFGHVMARVPGPVAFMVLPFETLWTQARRGTLQIGDAAPDFTLTKIDKSGQVQLSALTAQKKPVVLIFGSYT